MQFEFNKYKIVAYQHGFMLRKKINKKRWKTLTYHTTLEQACLELFNTRMLNETSQYVIDTTKSAHARLSAARLVVKLHQIRDEILKGLNNV